MTTPIDKTSVFQGAGLATSAPDTSTTKKSTQDQFLQLMIAQLKNQDPMKPMESGEFLSQLSQFQTASGVQSLQKSFDNFTNSFQSSSALQATSMVGRTVLVPSGSATLGANGLVMQAELTAPADQVKVNVFDQAGQLVRQMALGPQAAGMLPVKWDGESDRGVAVKPGQYVVQVESVQGGVSSAAKTYALQRVESVTIGQGGAGVTLNLAGSGSATLSDVKQIM